METGRLTSVGAGDIAGLMTLWNRQKGICPGRARVDHRADAAPCTAMNVLRPDPWRSAGPQNGPLTVHHQPGDARFAPRGDCVHVCTQWWMNAYPSVKVDVGQGGGGKPWGQTIKDPVPKTKCPKSFSF